MHIQQNFTSSNIKENEIIDLTSEELTINTNIYKNEKSNQRDKEYSYENKENNKSSSPLNVITENLATFDEIDKLNTIGKNKNHTSFLNQTADESNQINVKY